MAANIRAGVAESAIQQDGVDVIKFTSAGITSITNNGNLTFTGTGNRITGDFSNSLVSNRVLFQTSTANSITKLGIIPSGTATQSQFNLLNSSDSANSSIMQLYVDASTANLAASLAGTGSYVPIVFSTGGAERMRIDTSGNVLVTGSGGLGYGTGSGGTVTQATSKSTTVTLNKPSGQITMNNAALAANTSIGFTLSNSSIGANDSIVVNIVGADPSGYTYMVGIGYRISGSCVIHLRNVSGASSSDAVVLKFEVIKGAIS